MQRKPAVQCCLDEAAQLRGVIVGGLRQRAQARRSLEEIDVGRRYVDRLVFTRGVEDHARAGIELQDTAQRAADRSRDIDVGCDPVAVDHQRAESVQHEQLVALGGADIRADLDACRHEGLQPGGVGVEQEYAVQAEDVLQLDVAAELDADQELVEIEYDGGCGVAGVDLEAEVELAVGVGVGSEDGVRMGVHEGRLQRADHRDERGSTERRCPADVQGGQQLLHRGQAGTAIAILERSVEL